MPQNGVYLSKRSGVSTNYQINYTSPNLVFYDGSNVRTRAADLTSNRSFAVTFTHGGTAELYLDGLDDGAFSGTSSISDGSEDLAIGNTPDVVGDSPGEFLCSATLLFNRVLTATEMSELHAQLVSLRPPTRKFYHARASVIANPQESGLVGSWPMRIVGGIVPDESGNGYDLSVISGAPTHKSGLLGSALSFGGAEAAQYNTVPASLGGNGTFEAWVNVRTIPNVNGCVLEYSPGGTERYTISSAAGSFVFGHYNGVSTVAQGADAPQNHIHHVVATVQNGTTVRVYVDGVDGTKTGSPANLGAARITIGAIYGGSRYLDGDVYSAAVYSDVKDADWVQRQYAKGARAIQFSSGWGVPVSVAAEGGAIGQYLGGTPLRFGDATCRAKIVAERVTYGGTTKLCKVIECTTAGLLYMPTSLYRFASPTEAAYGLFDFLVNKGAEGNTTDVLFVASVAGGQAAGGQAAYLVRINSSEAVALNTQSATLCRSANSAISVGTWNRIHVARTPTGSFSIYLNGTLMSVAGGAGTNPVTDTSNTTSDYVVLDLDAGDKILWASEDGQWGLAKHLGVLPVAA